MLNFTYLFLIFGLVFFSPAYSQNSDIAFDEQTPRALPVVLPDVRIEEYIASSRVLKMYVGAQKEKLSQIVRDSLSTLVKQNNNKWLDLNQLKTAEHFFWNLVGIVDNTFSTNKLIGSLFGAEFLSAPRNWDDFQALCDPYLAGIRKFQNPPFIKSLFLVYQAFPDQEDRSRFQNFCDPYLYDPYEYLPYGNDIAERYNPVFIESLLLIYKEFPDENDRKLFLKFCYHYHSDMYYMKKYDQAACMHKLFPIYRAFPDENDRKLFLDFCNVYVKKMDENKKVRSTETLIPIYQAFPDENDRKLFLAFCDDYPVFSVDKPSCMRALLPIYQEFPDESDRKFFQIFCDKHLYKVDTCDRPYLMQAFIPIYKAFADEQGRKAFLEFCAPYIAHHQCLIDSAKVQARTNSNCMNQLLPIYQAFADEQERQAFVDFCDHCLDGGDERDKPFFMNVLFPIYQAFANEQGRNAFLEFCSPYLVGGNKRDRPRSIQHLLSIYLSDQKRNFELFTRLCPAQQMSQNWVSSLVSSYLPRSYLRYVRANGALKAEENPSDSRIKVMYETSSEYPLPVLYAQDPLLQYAGNTNDMVPDDLLPIQSDAAVKARIMAAPLRAQELFSIIRREDSGEIRRLIEHQKAIDGNEPELWQRYEAYYDDLYRRTKTEDGNGYSLDEHILMRDNLGNLVRTLNRGTQESRTEIVYYQSEFQVFEKTFTELMSKEFEEQKGVKY